MKKIPLRKCVVTQVQLPKKELLRVVKTPAGTVVVDQSGKANGRGAYIQKNLETLELAKKRGSLEKALDIKISEEVYEEIKNVISHG